MCMECRGGNFGAFPCGKCMYNKNTRIYERGIHITATDVTHPSRKYGAKRELGELSKEKKRIFFLYNSLWDFLVSHAYIPVQVVCPQSALTLHFPVAW